MRVGVGVGVGVGLGLGLESGERWRSTRSDHLTHHANHAKDPDVYQPLPSAGDLGHSAAPSGASNLQFDIPEPLGNDERGGRPSRPSASNQLMAEQRYKRKNAFKALKRGMYHHMRNVFSDIYGGEFGSIARGVSGEKADRRLRADWQTCIEILVTFFQDRIWSSVCEVPGTLQKSSSMSGTSTAHPPLINSIGKESMESLFLVQVCSSFTF